MNRISNLIAGMQDLITAAAREKDALVEFHTLLRMIHHVARNGQSTAELERVHKILRERRPTWVEDWEQILSLSQEEILNGRLDAAFSKLKVLSDEINQAH